VEGSVTLVLYDVAGRRVRTLLDRESRPAGAHTVEWDGRDGKGASVSSGVYIARIEANGFAKHLKMALVR